MAQRDAVIVDRVFVLSSLYSAVKFFYICISTRGDWEEQTNARYVHTFRGFLFPRARASTRYDYERCNRCRVTAR